MLIIIVAISFHGSEGYLGLRIQNIVVMRCTLPRCSLYPISYMQLVHPPCVSCPATDQPSPTPQDQAVAALHLAVASDGECYPRAWAEDSG
jgi:hypothetical protein